MTATLVRTREDAGLALPGVPGASSCGYLLLVVEGHGFVFAKSARVCWLLPKWQQQCIMEPDKGKRTRQAGRVSAGLIVGHRP